MHRLIYEFTFCFFLLDILVWLTIAVMVCNIDIKTKSYKLKMSKITKVIIIIFTLAAGFFSVLTNGLPDLGFSIISLMYAASVSVLLVFSQRLKIKREFAPKLRKINKKVGNIQYV